MTHTPPTAKSFAIALHAGAGVITRTIPDEKQRQYLDTLNRILTHGTNMLQNGASALDTVEEIACMLEDDPKFNAGKGAVYTKDAKHELEAAIMDGATLSCGAVTGLRTIKNPITLARQIMQNSQHIFLMGEGAESFADTTNVKRVKPTYFDTPHRLEQLHRFLNNHNKNHKQQVVEDANITNPETREGSTVGCVALDQQHNLAAATSTGGMTGKQFNRIGDTPIIGAGTYADNKTCAVSTTGHGESFIRICAAHELASLIRYTNKSLNDAANEIIHNQLTKGDGGLIAISKTGEIAMPFNSKGMFRAAADATGYHQIKIWH